MPNFDEYERMFFSRALENMDLQVQADLEVFNDTLARLENLRPRPVPPGVKVGARVRVRASSMWVGLPAFYDQTFAAHGGVSCDGVITELRPENQGVIILLDRPGTGFGGGFGYDEFEVLPPGPPAPTIWERLDDE